MRELLGLKRRISNRVRSYPSTSRRFFSRGWDRYADAMVRDAPFLRVRKGEGGDGRGVYSTHFLSSGTELYRCRPLATRVVSWGSSAVEECTCRYCLRPAPSNTFAVDGFGQVRSNYCSATCRDAALACRDEILLQCEGAGTTKDLLDIYARDDRKFPLMITEIIARILSDLRRGTIADVSCADHVGNLCHQNYAKSTVAALEEEHEAVIRAFSDANVVGHDDLRTFFPLREYARMVGALQLNAFEVVTRDDLVAVALLPGVASFFNHACEPSVSVSVDETTGEIVFVTTKDVPRFAQLHIAYVDVTDGSDACAERSTSLYDKYGFRCACSAETPLQVPSLRDAPPAAAAVGMEEDEEGRGIAGRPRKRKRRRGRRRT